MKSKIVISMAVIAMCASVFAAAPANPGFETGTLFLPLLYILQIV